MWLLLPSPSGASLVASGADPITSDEGEEARDSSVIARSWLDGAWSYSQLSAAAMRAAKDKPIPTSISPSWRRRDAPRDLPLSLRSQGKAMRPEAPKGPLRQIAVGRERDGGGARLPEQDAFVMNPEERGNDSGGETSGPVPPQTALSFILFLYLLFFSFVIPFTISRKALGRRRQVCPTITGYAGPGRDRDFVILRPRLLRQQLR